MLPQEETRLTAAEVILLAALDLHLRVCQTTQEFTEFDLTIEVWKWDQKRFGLPGYQSLYPDHKRVYSALISTKTSSPIYKEYMVKTKPNTYKMTFKGVTAAWALQKLKGGKSRGEDRQVEASN